jgi:hypothetical protein
MHRHTTATLLRPVRPRSLTEHGVTNEELGQHRCGMGLRRGTRFFFDGIFPSKIKSRHVNPVPTAFHPPPLLPFEACPGPVHTCCTGRVAEMAGAPDLQSRVNIVERENREVCRPLGTRLGSPAPPPPLFH